MNPSSLDDAALRARVDPAGMLAMVAGFPAQFEDAIASPLPKISAAPSRILLGGMGGSAVAGRILAPLLEAAGSLSLLVVDGYRLPASRAGDLLILCSYSGETEEVLHLYDAGSRLPRLVISIGGELGRRANADGVPRLSLPDGYPPRAALPSMLGRLLALLIAWGALPEDFLDSQALISDLHSSAALCGADRPAGENPAKQGAAAIADFRPAAVALAPEYSGAARRLRCQFEENASRCSMDMQLPELHHNSWVPWMEDPDILGAAVWMGAGDAHPRVLERRKLSEQSLSDRSIPFFEIPRLGSSLLNRVLTSVLIGDFISVYLAILRGVDPSRVDPLIAVKARLSEIR